MIKLQNLLLLFLPLMLLAGCHKPAVEGKWLQPVPGMAGAVQGVWLEDGGKASSINMSTLVYESWSHRGGELVLQGKSIGNGQTIDFSEAYRIKKLTDRELVLQAGKAVLQFSRGSDD